MLDPYPDKGKKGEVVESLIIGGGPVPTALLTVVKFGFTARFCGKVGDDQDGRFVCEGLKEGGVDVSPMLIDKDTTTARAHIWIDARDGSRTVALDRSKLTWHTAAQLNPELPRLCRVFLCDGRASEATLKGIKLAKEAGVVTVLDTGSVRARLLEMLELVDFAVVSADLADTLSPGAPPDEIAQKLVHMGAGAAVVTCGKSGAVYFDGTICRTVPGFEVDVVDTTGAGDVFHGALVFCLLNSWDLARSVSFANAAAALSCRKLSGKAGIPRLDEVETLLKSG